MKIHRATYRTCDIERVTLDVWDIVVSKRFENNLSRYSSKRLSQDPGESDARIGCIVFLQAGELPELHWPSRAGFWELRRQRVGSSHRYAEKFAFSGRIDGNWSIPPTSPLLTKETDINIIFRII